MQPTDGLKVEFQAPCQELREFVSAYHIFDTGSFDGCIRREAFFPGWANLRFRDPKSTLSVEFRNRKIDQVPLNCLFGPSSYLARARTNGGRLIGVGLTPIGFSRIFGTIAFKIADNIVDFTQLNPKFPKELVYEVHNCDNVKQVAEILDDVLLNFIKKPRTHEAIARDLWQRTNENHHEQIETICSSLQIEEHQLRRISKRFFGFTPKILLRRTRFLKSIISLATKKDQSATEIIESDYFDYSHFVKDSYEFFGMSPREFIELDAPLLKLSFQKRAQELGAHVQSLHRL